jgi:anti-sigma regulatory factor (Ser/Thr protein kinase)
MNTGAGRDNVGHFHEAGFYRSDAEFRALIVPFVEEGVAAGEPVIIGYRDRKADLLRSWLSDPDAVTFIGHNRLYSTPARSIAAYRRFFESRVAMGAGQIRLAGDVPYPGNGGQFEGWDRYESAINSVWQEFPVWGRCLYDAAAPAAVHDVVTRTHPYIVSADGARRASESFEGVPAFTGLIVAPDPLEASPPAVEVVNASALDARRALMRAARGMIPSSAIQDLLVAVSEAVNNAAAHGRRPWTVQIWAAANRVIIRVHDQGRGPVDPLAGLVPPPDSAQKSGLGLGLWLMHQLDIDVALIRGDDGFTVRLRAGDDQS